MCRSFPDIIMQSAVPRPSGIYVDKLSFTSTAMYGFWVYESIISLMYSAYSSVRASISFWYILLLVKSLSILLKDLFGNGSISIFLTLASAIACARVPSFALSDGLSSKLSSSLALGGHSSHLCAPDALNNACFGIKVLPPFFATLLQSQEVVTAVIE